MVQAFLAVDQSTSATKAMLFSQHGELLDQVALSHRQLYPQAGWVEHDAEEIYQNFIAVAGDLLARRPELAAQVVSLSITNQRETYVVFDRATGKPLHNAVVWLCRRGESICRDLVAAGHEERVHTLTGLKIDTYFPASKLAWLLAERPELWKGPHQLDDFFETVHKFVPRSVTVIRQTIVDALNICLCP